MLASCLLALLLLQAAGLTQDNAPKNEGDAVAKAPDDVSALSQRAGGADLAMDSLEYVIQRRLHIESLEREVGGWIMDRVTCPLQNGHHRFRHVRPIFLPVVLRFFNRLSQ